MKLRHPVLVEASSTAINTESAPVVANIQYDFPARPKEGKINMPAVSVYWYDGGLLPRCPEGLPDGAELGVGRNGVIFQGSKGTLVCGNYGEKYKLLPESKFSNSPKPPASLRRVGMSHEMDFVRACKESPQNKPRKNM